MTACRAAVLGSGLAVVKDRIAAAASAAGRDPAELTLVVVTKYFPVSDLIALAALGVGDIGESRDQEARAKLAEFDEAAAGREETGLRVDNPTGTLEASTPLVRPLVHMVGQVQTKKARSVARWADVVHSVDRSRLVGALDRAVAVALQEGERSTPMRVLLQVDLENEGEADSRGRAGHTTDRGGTSGDGVMALGDQVASSSALELAGVMAVAPRGLDDAGLRRAFQRLADVSARVRAEHPSAGIISAGMSADLEQAIAAGATHLRVGSAILGTRPEAR